MTDNHGPAEPGSTSLPDRVRTLTAVSVPHLAAPDTPRQREMAWYTLFFQFAEIAEATLQYDDWAALRELTPGYKDIDRAIADLSRPGALTATLNWYRANLAPRMPGPRPDMELTSRADRGSFHVRGFAGQDKPAHANQLYAFGDLLLPYLRERWR